jgi:multidrug efflux system outer membrane protein
LFDKRLLIFSCFLLLSSCFLFGPTYKKPQLNIPLQWPNQQAIKINENIYLPDLVWWKLFDSPELNALIIKALKRNGEPNTALANIEYAQSQLLEIKLSWLPTLSLFAGYSQFPILGNPGLNIIAFPLYIVNIIQQYKQQKGAKARYEASIYARDCIKLSIIAQVSTAFFALLQQEKALTIHQDLMKDYQTYLKLVQNQYKNGLTSLDSIDMLQSQIKETESQIDITKHNIIVSKNALHYLVNDNPGELVINKTFDSINTNGVIPGELPVCVLTNRPDIRRAEALLRAANADVGAAIAAYLPSISLGAFLGTSSRQGGIYLAQAGMSTPVIDLPIFAQVKGSKASYKVAYINYIVAVRAALRDVANDLSAYTAYSDQLKNNLSALESKKQHCYLVEKRYSHGISDKLELMQCKIIVDQFNLLVNKNKLEKMTAIVTLYQDLAGGYNGV